MLAVYSFVSNPDNLPKWASGLAKSIKKMGNTWIAETPRGQMKIRFADQNGLGVLDHFVTPSSGPEVFVPMRVVRNGDGSEIVFTLFRQPEMSQEQFVQDAKWVEKDLARLKSVLEG